MDQFNSFVQELQTIFEKHADIKVKTKQEKFLNNKFHFYGILTTKRKPLVKALLQKWNKELTIETKRLLFAQLYGQTNREFQYTAMEFINYWWKKNLSFHDLDWLLNIIRHNIWWDTTDYFDHIFGFILFNMENKDQAKEYLLKLIKDQDFWVQRIAIQSQLMLKEKMDIDLLFLLIIPFLQTDNFYLIRSIGWALRNAKRINKTKVDDFVTRYNVSKKIISVINEH